jgi:hypothetical protein
MSFNYSNIFDKTPCFVLIKNLRYVKDNSENPIESGEIIKFSANLTSLMAELNRPTLEFDSKEKLKYFLYSMGFFSDLQNFSGDMLLQHIEAKSLSEIDSKIHDDFSNDAVLKVLLETQKLKNWEIMYDFGGTAYQQPNKIRDYQFLSETFDIRFFGGNDQEKMFQFIFLYFEKHRYQNDLNATLKEIRFDFFEMMDEFNGKTKIYPYDLWHEFLTYLYQNELIDEEVYNFYLNE